MEHVQPYDDRFVAVPSLLPVRDPSTTIEPVRAPRRPPFTGAIPVFPRFKPLAIADRPAIEAFVGLFPLTSDFNFISLWCWNTDGDIEVSWLNDNLVVKFKDYTSPLRFLSFLGEVEIVETAATLLEYARGQKDRGLDSRLQLIPAFVIARAPEMRDWARVLPDRGQYDYVISTAEWSAMAGGHFKTKRHLVHQLERGRAPEFRPIDIGRRGIQRQIHAVFGQWAVQRGAAGQPGTVLQSLALKRIFSLERPGDLASYGVYLDGKLAAYSINERLADGSALGHFWRADRSVNGLYPYLLRETCAALLAGGTRYLNTMQDLDVPGLRTAKLLDRPDHLIPKYTLAPVDEEIIRLIVEPESLVAAR